MLDFPVLYACARDGYAMNELDEDSADLRPLLDAIVDHVPPPSDTDSEGAQLLVTNLDYDPYVGRLCLGRLRGAPLRKNEQCTAGFGAEDEQEVRAARSSSTPGVGCKRLRGGRGGAG